MTTVTEDGEMCATAQPHIEVQGISKTFSTGSGSIKALDDVTVSFHRGEFVSLLGPSGCGKTTLLRILAGLERADAGVVSVGGTPVSAPGRDRAMVFQAFGLLPWKTVAQNVAFPLRLRRLPRAEINARVAKYLDLVGLEAFTQRYPHQLSGGMQQRVGLARALAVDPEILLMDEPFGAIDAQQRQLMQEELLRICAKAGKTVVFVTHDLDEAIYLSQRIVLLSPHPGSVKSIIEVNLPSPRWEYDVRSHERFIDVRRDVWSVLRTHLIDEVRREREDHAG